MQITEDIDILQQFRLDISYIEINTKAKCVDCYYSTLFCHAKYELGGCALLA